MDTNTNANNACPRSEAILSYIYAEMPDGERSRFQSHILDCQSCTDEFAGISEARFEVFDWKRTEFDELATPMISIPYREQAVTLREWFAGWMGVAAAVPAFALVLVAMIGGYSVWLTTHRVDRTGVAEIEPMKIQTAGPATLSAVPSVSAANETRAVVPVRSQTKPQPQYSKAKPSPRAASLPQSQYAKHIAPRIKLSSDVASTAEPSLSKKLPRLGIYDDDNDTSLRLAELLDETGPPQD